MNTYFRWRPATYAPPRPSYKADRSLGQAVPLRGSEAFLASPALALATDFIGVVAAGYLSYGLAQPSKTTGAPINKTMSVIWLVIASGLAMKGLHDFSRVNA